MREASEMDVGPGWRSIVKPLIEYCKLHAVPILQIKEKFASLRFYYSNFNLPPGERREHYLDTLIEEAECKAEETCEWCGEPGKRTQGGWIKTLCPEHTQRWYDGERWWVDKDGNRI